ncbi:MAG: hypothetical protein A3G39_09615 [Deltaproteobacteria bacterium RIFCSPLOWO2_12_FULL_43_16]|nr:MAG: hypothetical protein A2Z89_06295 [Deltaproteobacteria bacterium GWA2_43_19]OGQ10964.1 MAG: hypothetical protein A3D30_01725 [Deltaproteobacteria bacterium RIFCSPHIGHO2_02_FULL_43_33]OGQ60104.1 MAG: hypothetical protein A3G39_09615 [Deltaproteobacteria bacterium RIFCSPLOWO2_12_FULL_43_16]
MAQIFFKPKKKSLPRLCENLFTEGNYTLIGVAGGSDVKGMIKDAVSLIGGFEKLNIKGKIALVKPNVVSGEPHPATTNPQVVGAVVKLLYEYGAAKIYVGDMSALATLSTLRNMKNNGIKKAAEENGAEVIIFEDYAWIEVELPRNQYIKTAYVTEWLYKTDIIINLPVIKTHRSASYSITLKNFIGCTHLKQRPYLIDSSHWEEIVAEFNVAYAPDLNIVDGTVSMIEGGPWEGTAANTNLIIASGDRVAADAVGLGIIKSFGKWKMVAEKDIWEQKQIATAVSRGIGSGKNNIKLLEGRGDEKFKELMKKVRENTGL